MSKLKTIFFNLYYNFYICFFIVRLSILIRMTSNIHNLVSKHGKKFLQFLSFLGFKLSISGLEYIEKKKMPLVFVSNHMTFLETFIICYFLNDKTTFVVKKELLGIAFFKTILYKIKSIVIERKSPRKDLSIVLKEGRKHLKNGVNVVIFPQRGRRLYFNSNKFNTLGIKLALESKVNIQVLAVKTDFFRSVFASSFGILNYNKKIYFEFSPILELDEKNKNEIHEQCKEFINTRFKQWNHNEKT